MEGTARTWSGHGVSCPSVPGNLALSNRKAVRSSGLTVPVWAAFTSVKQRDVRALDWEHGRDCSLKPEAEQFLTQEDPLTAVIPSGIMLMTCRQG